MRNKESNEPDCNEEEDLLEEKLEEETGEIITINREFFDYNLI
jgi:hypothetical protein